MGLFLACGLNECVTTGSTEINTHTYTGCVLQSDSRQTVCLSSPSSHLGAKPQEHSAHLEQSGLAPWPAPGLCAVRLCLSARQGAKDHCVLSIQ